MSLSTTILVGIWVCLKSGYPNANIPWFIIICPHKMPSWARSVTHMWKDTYTHVYNMYPLVIKHGNGKSPTHNSFNGIIVYEWWIFSCHVWLPEDVQYVYIYICIYIIYIYIHIMYIHILCYIHYIYIYYMICIYIYNVYIYIIYTEYGKLLQYIWLSWPPMPCQPWHFSGGIWFVNEGEVGFNGLFTVVQKLSVQLG